MYNEVYLIWPLFQIEQMNLIDCSLLSAKAGQDKDRELCKAEYEVKWIWNTQESTSGWYLRLCFTVNGLWRKCCTWKKNLKKKKKSRRCFSHIVYYFLQFMRTLSLCIKVTFHLCTYLFGLLKRVSWKHIKNMKGNVILGVKGCVLWQDIYK